MFALNVFIGLSVAIAVFVFLIIMGATPENRRLDEESERRFAEHDKSGDF